MSCNDYLKDKNYHRVYMPNRKNLIPVILTTMLVILFGTIQPVAGQPIISFFNPLSGGPAESFLTFNDPVGIKIDDSTNSTFTDVGTGIQTISVIVTSGVESIEIPLKETGEETGIFTNKDLLLTKDTDKEFQVGDFVTINQREDSPFLSFDSNNIIDSIFVEVDSVTDPDAFDLRSSIPELTLIETGPNTAEFIGHVSLTAGPTTGSALEITNGDTLAVVYNGAVTWALITPNPDDGIQILRTDFKCPLEVDCDTITVSYADAEDASLDIEPGEGGGGSGGGLLRPGFVLDILSGGASGGDFLAPQLIMPKLNLSSLPLVGDILDFFANADPFTPITPLDDPSIDYPLSINGNGYLLTQYANTIQTYKGMTGDPISFKMTLFDSTGVEHIGLYTNLRGDHREISDSDTFVIYHEDKPLEITDPNGFFSNVNFTESEYNGKYIAEFNMTFARPMDTSDIIIRTWDELLNSGDIKVFDAIKIEGEPLVNPDINNLIIPDSAEIVIPYYKLPHYEIPLADTEGNLVYYNSFGGLEEKKVNSYYDPIVYPNEIGKEERHDDGFRESIINEEIRAQLLINTLIEDPFKSTMKRSDESKFQYPNSIGKLDREKKTELIYSMIHENEKASYIFKKLYQTNHVND